MDLLGRVKKKTDIVVQLSNGTYETKEMNIWDGIWYDQRDKMPQSFIVGSIRFWCSTVSFFSNAEIELDGKIYKLLHYITKENNQDAIIYDFGKGWLAPLNIPMSFDKPIKIIIPSNTLLTVTISVV